MNFRNQKKSDETSLEIKPNILSTDTHEINHVNFAWAKLYGVLQWKQSSSTRLSSWYYYPDTKENLNVP